MIDRSEAVLAIDIGGTKIAFGEVVGDRIDSRRQVPTPRSGGGDALVDAIVTELGGFKCDAIALATTGIVSNGKITALNPITLPIEDNYPLAARLEAATGLVPLVVNDAQAAAWGEYRYGAGRGCRNFMFITVSTGVGGGVVLEGHLQVGANGLAGHIGHTRVSSGRSACGCGRKGCLETIASGTAIALNYSNKVGQKATAPEVFDAATAGDAIAQAVLEDAAAALAEAFANTVATVDLDLVAIGGGVGLAAGFADRVRRHFEAFPVAFRRPIVTAQAGADAGMIGVADLL
ncbi:N-acetylmannosamine kinase [Mesorhizobium sp. 1M-11]|uniref:N-acetylmannosamine kinase n=1 Tax=Mesorhizobium sp. 1M-11 TaxID=1529006 RepID=UPI0006C76AEE|nr:N-acetylmannosamine kinase [Mesorhizobium sp. 1M-11]